MPPELQALLQKMEHLQLSSVRLSDHVVFGSPTGTLTLDALAKARRTPNESAVTTTLTLHKRSGKTTSEITGRREIGNRVYVYEPRATRGDGGRPWVRERRERSRDQSPATSFKGLAGQLNTAESIVETGTTTINGQQVRQFTATFASGVYPQSELPFGELLGNACAQPVQLNLDFNAVGLPVLIGVNETYLRSGETLTSTNTTEIVATNFPFVALKPPPARKTISAAALHKFQLERIAKKLRKLKKRHA